MDGYLKSVFVYLLFWGCLLYLIVLVAHPEQKCSIGDCTKNAEEGNSYCYVHEWKERDNTVYKNSPSNRSNKMSMTKVTSYSSISTSKSGSTSSSAGSSKGYSSGSVNEDKKSTTSKKKVYNAYDSYDTGYEDVYDNDDYDWDRYYSDDDYADGVDDAMDELDW